MFFYRIRLTFVNLSVLCR